MFTFILGLARLSSRRVYTCYYKRVRVRFLIGISVIIIILLFIRCSRTHHLRYTTYERYKLISRIIYSLNRILRRGGVISAKRVPVVRFPTVFVPVYFQIVSIRNLFGCQPTRGHGGRKDESGG